MEPWQWVIAGLGAYAVGLSKTGIAGLGVLAVALFASALPARESTGLVLVVLLAADIVSALLYRNEVCWPQLRQLLPWAATGVVAGFFVMNRIDALTTQRLMGIILIVLVLIQLVRLPSTRQAHHMTPAEKPRQAATTGVVAGAASMITNAAGPVVVLHLISLELPKLFLMGTAAWYFLLINLCKLPFSYMLGLITPQSLHVSLLLAPLAVGGALTGRWVIHRINQRVFDLSALVLTLLAGLRLLLV